MSKIWLVAFNEYRRIVFRKTFLLALLSVPMMITLGGGSGYFVQASRNSDDPMGYVDLAGFFSDPIPTPIDGTRTPIEMIRFEAAEDAKAALDAKEIQAYYVLHEDFRETRRVDLFYIKTPGKSAKRQFRDFLQVNLLPEFPTEVSHRAALVGQNITVRSFDGRREVPSGGPTFGMITPLFISLALMFLLVFSSGYLMMAVADEKENRTMEVLITSVSPTEFIGGKVFGVAMVTATQVVIWGGAVGIGLAIARGAGIEWFQDFSMDWRTVGTAVLIAIPTFVLAAALMAAIGATVTTTQEGQALGAVFFMLHFLPTYLTIHTIVTTPHSALPTVLSMTPFTAIFTIALRNTFTVVPLWQIVTSFAVQTVCAFAAIRFAGQAFRMGMLRYGQRLKWRERLKVRSK